MDAHNNSAVKLLCFLLLFSCGKVDQKPKPGFASNVDQLREKYERIKSDAARVFDNETGWPSRYDCDGTLWAGLAVAAGLDTVQIALAEYSPGEIHRRPAPSCYVAGDQGSGTTISRDMLTGYMWGLWSRRDLAAFERLANYGESHAWKMGEPLGDGRVILTGNGIGLLGRAIKKLGGPEKIYRGIRPIYTKVDDYQRHLMILGILLDGEVDEGSIQQVDITQGNKDLLQWATEQEPENATAQAGWATYNDGNFDKTIDILLKDDFYVPGYVRGHENYRYVYWLFSAKLVLKRIK